MPLISRHICNCPSVIGLAAGPAFNGIVCATEKLPCRQTEADKGCRAKAWQARKGRQGALPASSDDDSVEARVFEVGEPLCGARLAR